MTNSLDRRDFIRALLAASACFSPYSFLHPEGVYVASLRTSEYGDGIILRLYEGAGLQSSATIQFHLPQRKVIAAMSCDGREKNLSTLKSDTASLEVSLKPFETNTVRVRFG
jgi:alpha-mannosidase